MEPCRHADDDRGISRRSAFTLVELLIVITIITILLVVVVIVLNPEQLLAQSRDAQRISDLATVNSAVSFYESQEEGATNFSLGSSTQVSLSIADPTATSSAGTACGGLGVFSASVYTDRCMASSTYKKTDGTGWVPVDLTSLGSGSPFSSLPVDPVNQTTSGLYYTYETNGTQWVLTAFLESTKYAAKMASSNGVDPALYEVGIGASSLPVAGRGMVGYWPLNEGSGTVAYDYSGNGNNAAWNGTPIGTSGYYSQTPTGWVGTFNGNRSAGVADYVSTAAMPWGLPLGSAPRTMTAWFEITSTTPQGSTLVSWGANGPPSGMLSELGVDNTTSTGGPLYFGAWGNDCGSATIVPMNQWHFAAVTYDGANDRIYLDGSLVGQCLNNPRNTTSSPVWIGARVNYTYADFPGYISDAAIYNYALSQPTLAQMYRAGM
jgi:prepilin-type N-terminal cleavage/methylation domain-containing protein